MSFLVIGDEAEFLARYAVEPGACGNHQIGLIPKPALERDAVDLEMADVGGVTVRKRILAAVGGGDGNAGGIGKAHDCIAAVLDGDHFTGDDERAFGCGDELAREIEAGAVRDRAHQGLGGGDGGSAGIAFGDVLRHDDDHRARPADVARRMARAVTLATSSDDSGSSTALAMPPNI